MYSYQRWPAHKIILRSAKQAISNFLSGRLTIVIVLYLIITIILSAIFTFCFLSVFLDFLNNLTTSIADIFSLEHNRDDFFSILLKVITYFSSFLIFSFFLMPASVTVSIFFENQISKCVLKDWNISTSRSKLNVNMIRYLNIIFRYLGIGLLVNIILLPFYLTVPIANIIIFVTANGFILSKQLYHSLLLSYFSDAEIKFFLVKNRWTLFVTGTYLSIMFTIPLVNIITPVLAIIVCKNTIIFLHPELFKFSNNKN